LNFKFGMPAKGSERNFAAMQCKSCACWGGGRQLCGLCRPSVPSTLFSLRYDMNWNFVPLIAINQWQQLFSNRFIIR
jgi:hypothetical protein